MNSSTKVPNKAALATRVYYCAVFLFTSKSSDLRTQYLPEGQTDAEVFVKRNIDISSIYAAILYLFQFKNKNGRFPVCLPVTVHAWDQKVER